MNVISISLARGVLEEGSRERTRMDAYARQLTSLHMVVLTRAEHGYSNVEQIGNLYLYPTNSRTRLMMLYDAWGIILRIARKRDTSARWVLSAQDPLEIGWVSQIIAWVTHIPLHVQVHGDYFSSNAWVEHSLVRWFRRFVASMFLKRVIAIRVVSERIKKSLVSLGIPEARITVLPIRPELEEFLSVVHKVSTDTTVCTFLYLGRLAPEKDIARIVYACARIYAKYSNVRLRIVGSGTEKQKIESLIETLAMQSVITIIPWTKHVAQEMAQADVFLLASKHEAYALTLIEAMAVGLPLITTNVGCVGEIVQDGVQGIVVYKEGIESYANAMERMITDVSFRKYCAEQGKKSAQRIAQDTQEAYIKGWVTSLSKTFTSV